MAFKVYPTGGTTFTGGTVTSPILFPDGTPGAPSIAFSSDSDTGFYSEGTLNTVKFSANSALAITFNTSGISLLGATGSLLNWGNQNAFAWVSDGVTKLYDPFGTTPMALRVYGDGTTATAYTTVSHSGSAGTIATTGPLFLDSGSYIQPLDTLTGEGGVNLLGFKRAVLARTTSEAAAITFMNRPITNEGASAKYVSTLPSAVLGYNYEYVVQDADGIRVTANTGDTIRINDNVTATAGYIESTTIGDTVTLVAINTTEWIVTAGSGTWTDGTWTTTINPDTIYANTSVISPIVDSGAAANLVLKRDGGASDGVEVGSNEFIPVTGNAQNLGTTSKRWQNLWVNNRGNFGVDVITPIVDSGAAANLDLKYNGTTMLSITSLGMSLQGSKKFYGWSHLVQAYTGDATESVATSGYRITNEGAAAKTVRTLPTAASGYTWTYIIQDADGTRVVAATGDTIRVLDKVTASAGYIESTTIGSVVTLVAINATEWVATSIHGVWTDGTFTYDDTGNTSP